MLRGMTQVGQYTSMVVDMCERYDTGRSVYKHGSRHVCVERYDTGRSVYKYRLDDGFEVSTGFRSPRKPMF